MRILVADDSAVTRTIVTRLLKHQFLCEVLEAKDGLETMTLLEREDVDVLLLDVSMPVLSGMDVLSAIRRDPRYAELPVVVMTSTTERSTAESLIRLGVTDYLLKPLHSPATAKRLGEVIARIQSLGVPARSEGDRPSLLLVGLDGELRKFFVARLGDRFDIHEAETGPGGLRAFLDTRPEAVFLGEGLSLLSETWLARKMRADGTRVFLCARGEVAPDVAEAFTSIIPGSSDAELFSRAVESAMAAAAA